MFEIDGIVLGTTPFNEHDSIVNVITKQQFFSFLAKGVLKIDSKNASLINLCNYSRFNISKGKTGYSLRNGELLNSFQNAKKDLAGLSALSFIREITFKFIQDDDAIQIFDFFKKSLELLDNNKNPFFVCLLYFAQVLKIAGYGLNADSCQLCGSKHDICAISYENGGMICKKCYSGNNGKAYSARKLKIFRYIFKVELSKFGEIEFNEDECKELLTDLLVFANNVSQVNIKSHKMLFMN